jgi:hypothetical protein
MCFLSHHHSASELLTGKFDEERGMPGVQWQVRWRVRWQVRSHLRNVGFALMTLSLIGVCVSWPATQLAQHCSCRSAEGNSTGKTTTAIARVCVKVNGVLGCACSFVIRQSQACLLCCEWDSASALHCSQRKALLVCRIVHGGTSASVFRRSVHIRQFSGFWFLTCFQE